MRISDLERSDKIVGSDKFVFDGAGKTRNISASDLAKSLFRSFGSDILEGLSVDDLADVSDPNENDCLILGTDRGIRKISIKELKKLIGGE